MILTLTLKEIINGIGLFFVIASLFYFVLIPFSIKKEFEDDDKLVEEVEKMEINKKIS